MRCGGDERAKARPASGDLRGVPVGVGATAGGYGAGLANVDGGAEASTAARQRLLDAVAREARLSRTVQTSGGGWWWGWLGWAATAAMILFAVSLWRDNSILRATVASESFARGGERTAVGRAEKIAAPIIEPEAQRVTTGLRRKTSAAAAGKGILFAEARQSGFSGSNMPALPPQKAYEFVG